MSADSVGICEHCGSEFTYRLVHNGFNDSAYAYCNSCGCTALLSGWFERIPREANLKLHGPIPAHIEHLLEPCACGGQFKATALPRCSRCTGELSAELARSWIERNAPGTRKGWSWQGSWSGVYSIIIDKKSVSDPWAQA